jgi:hypothetical protein
MHDLNDRPPPAPKHVERGQETAERKYYYAKFKTTYNNNSKQEAQICLKVKD